MCYEQQETWWMQLRTSKGFRAIHCKHCRFQEYTAKTRCQCGARWHQCKVHRVDPLVHSSRRGKLRAVGEKKAIPKSKTALRSSLRAAPILVNQGTKRGKGAAGRRKRMKKTNLTRHAATFKTLYPPAIGMLQRIRLKIAAARLQRAQEVEPNSEQSSSSSTIAMGTRINEMRGSGHHPIKPITLTRDGLKQALLAKAAEDKSNSKRQKVSPKPTSTTITRATTPRPERQPDSRSAESYAIMRLLGR